MTDRGGTEELEEDIAGWQADWNLAPDVLGEVVRRASGSKLASDERILEGHGNEVHAVVTQAGEALIVRVAWRSGPAFDNEIWPLTAARRAGLPVADVLLVEHTSLDGRDVSFNVQTRLSGSSVFRLVPALSDEELETLTCQAGEALAGVHSLPVPGRGPISPEGQIDHGLAPDHDVVEAVLERQTYLVDHGVDPGLVQQATDFVSSASGLLAQAPITLVHGDWRTTNLLAHRGSITGIVDWEGARGDDPAIDFAGVWTIRSRPEATATELLLDAYYQAGGSIDPSFEARRLVYTVADLHSALGHYVYTARPDLLASAILRLRAILD